MSVPSVSGLKSPAYVIGNAMVCAFVEAFTTSANVAALPMSLQLPLSTPNARRPNAVPAARSFRTVPEPVTNETLRPASAARPSFQFAAVEKSPAPAVHTAAPSS